MTRPGLHNRRPGYPGMAKSSCSEASVVTFSGSSDDDYDGILHPIESPYIV